MSEVSLLQGLPVLVGISGRREETEEASSRLHVSGTCFAVIVFINRIVQEKSSAVKSCKE